MIWWMKRRSDKWNNSFFPGFFDGALLFPKPKHKQEIQMINDFNLSAATINNRIAATRSIITIDRQTTTDNNKCNAQQYNSEIRPVSDSVHFVRMCESQIRWSVEIRMQTKTDSRRKEIQIFLSFSDFFFLYLFYFFPLNDQIPVENQTKNDRK